MNKIYVILNDQVEDMVYYNDLDGFSELVKDGVSWDEKEFASEAEQTAFVEGLFFGIDERSPAGLVVLYEDDEAHKEFIKLLKAY